MKIHLTCLIVHTRQTIERIDFSEVVTFIYGPISKGKSTVARLVDYCLGGDLERTPAIRQEFLSSELSLVLGEYNCTIERGADDTQAVRVTWEGPNNDIGSVNAPLDAQDSPLIDAEVYNLSDLIFYLCGVTPIKVRKRFRDPDSPLIRLSFRDIWWYCYLEQMHLDSSCFHLEDPFRGRKSQDAMRFFTGLHSERLSQLEGDLIRTLDEQRSKREAVQQIRSFMTRFDFGSAADLEVQLQATEEELVRANENKTNLEHTRSVQTHPTDSLRDILRKRGAEINDTQRAILECNEFVVEQRALRAEFITAKTKAERTNQAGQVLDGVSYQRCPECGADVSERSHSSEQCRLCGSSHIANNIAASQEIEALRRDLNDRIDQITDSISRREHELNRMNRLLARLQREKEMLDRQLQEELARYDSAFVESIRVVERDMATLKERIRSLQQLQEMPKAINALEEDAGKLQGRIDGLRSSVDEERKRLRAADANIAAIAAEFKRIMLSVSFPGVSMEDDVIIDPRNWRPTVVHNEQEWTFWDAGSGGKKTLFNVCYALAVHAVALSHEMPVPDILIIDGPTKNISDDEDPELVQSLYAEIYRLAESHNGRRLQFLLIDSDLVVPTEELSGFSQRRIAGEPDAPSLIPYYSGP